MAKLYNSVTVELPHAGIHVLSLTDDAYRLLDTADVSLTVGPAGGQNIPCLLPWRWKNVLENLTIWRKVAQRQFRKQQWQGGIVRSVKTCSFSLAFSRSLPLSHNLSLSWFCILSPSLPPPSLSVPCWGIWDIFIKVSERLGWHCSEGAGEAKCLRDATWTTCFIHKQLLTYPNSGLECMQQYWMWLSYVCMCEHACVHAH